MKKTLVAILIFISVLVNVQAQSDKGFWTGISVNGGVFTTLTNNRQGIFQYNIGTTLKGAYAFGDRWSLGLKMTLAYGGISGFRSYNAFYSPGVFVRYTQPLTLQGKFALWGEITAQYGNRKGYINDAGGKRLVSGGSSIGTELAGGFLIFPRKHLGIEIGVGSLIGYYYLLSSVTTPNSVGQSSFSIFNLKSISPQVGLNYYFGR